MSIRFQHLTVILTATCAVLISTYEIYSNALGADFNFDDIPNLIPLASIHDFPSALRVIFSGTAGPTGRPLAISTFALQFYAWPHSPQTFLYVNILIHLINCLLVLWFSLLMAESRSDPSMPIALFSLTLFTLWALQPLLASSSLLIIQRMTTLSATFVLSGIIGYLKGREWALNGKSYGWLLMGGSLACGSVLAGLSKETGFLLPIYVWILELTVLSTHHENPRIRLWQNLLYIPPIVLCYYITVQLKYFFETSHRGFSSWERLLTEGPILWEYIRLIFLPNSSALGPYHDDVAVIRGLTLTSSMAWLAWIIIISIAVRQRKKRPWLGFAVGWFLAGHGLESSIFNLELYFEHRNYLPSLGPLALLSYIVVRVPPSLQRVGIIAFLIYIALFGVVLNEITKTWGEPDLAAQIWAEKHPHSERAQQFLAQRYTARRDFNGAQRAIDNAFERNPRSAGLAMQSLQVTCALKQDSTLKGARAKDVLIDANLDFATLDALKKLLDIYMSDGCQGLDSDYLHALIDTMLANPNYLGSPPTAFSLYHFKSSLYIESRELDPAVRHLELAFNRVPDLDTAVLIVGLLDSAGLQNEALDKISYFTTNLPANPVLRHMWVARLSEIEEDLMRQLGKQNAKQDSE